MKVRKILPVLLCVCFLMGCANSVTETETEKISVQAMKQTTAIPAADINYEVPKDVPKILVNQVGYKPGNDKVAVFRGENLPSVFRVINVETGECVYTGVIDPGKYNEELQEYNSYGDFSKFQEPGTYYIMADVIGMSYPFNIAETVYDPVLQEAFRGYADYIEKAETYTMCEELAVLLLSFELYRSGYTDDMNIPESGNGIPDILDLAKKTTERLFYRQNELTGGVSAGSGMTGENAEASIHFAAVMSKFYNSCKIYDKGYAETCLRAAVKAFDYAQPSFEEMDGSLVYFAATELYRATGMAKYAAVADTYRAIDNRSSDKGITGYFYGDVTYLSTAFPVDTKVCEILINSLRDKVEDIAGNSKEAEYFTCGNKKQDNNEELLDAMMELLVINYIIANHEYDMVLQNHLHYFLGRNAQCITYVKNAGYTRCADGEALTDNSIHNAKLMALLTAIGQCEQIVWEY